VRLGADRLADAVTVTWTPLESPEDEHVERPLKQFQALVVLWFCHSRRQSTAFDVDCLRLVPRLRASRATAGDRPASALPQASNNQVGDSRQLTALAGRQTLVGPCRHFVFDRAKNVDRSDLVGA